MGATRVRSQYGTGAGATPASFSFDVGTAGTDRYVVLFISTEVSGGTGPPYDSGATVGGVAGTMIQQQYDSTVDGTYVAAYYWTESDLGSGTTGSQTVTWTATGFGTSNSDWHGTVYLYTNAEDQAPSASGKDHDDDGGTPMGFTGVTTSAGDTMLFAQEANRTGKTVSALPTGFTLDNQNDEHMSAYDDDIATAHSSATLEVTYDFGGVARAGTVWMTFAEKSASSPSTITLDALEVTATLEELTVTPEPSTIPLDGLEVTSTLEELTVTPEPSTIALDGLEVTSTLEDLGVTPEPSSIALDGLEVTSTLEELTVEPAGTPSTIALDALEVTSTLEELVVTPEPSTIALEGMEVTATLEELVVTPEPSTIPLDGLEVTSTLEELAVVPLPSTIPLEDLTPTATLGELVVTPVGAPSTIVLDDLAPTATLGELSVEPLPSTVVLDGLEVTSTLEELVLAPPSTTIVLDGLEVTPTLEALVLAPLPSTIALGGIEVDATLEELTVVDASLPTGPRVAVVGEAYGPVAVVGDQTPKARVG